jgi:hypothetical protein
MRIIKNFQSFNEELVASKPDTTTKPTTTPAPTTTPRPTRPGVVPTERPGTEDAPLASAEDVVDRFSDIYSDLPNDEKEEIDSYFENKK